MLSAREIVDKLLEAGGPLHQRRPFQVTLTQEYKQSLRDDAARFNTAYGIFFDTSGRVHVERINPTRKYEYIWRTDVEESTPSASKPDPTATEPESEDEP